MDRSLTRAGAALLLLFAARPVLAQVPENALLDRDPYFDGAVIRASFRVPQFAAVRQLTEVRVDLPASIELLAVIAAAESPPVNAVDLACDPTGSPYDCGPVVYTNQNPQTVTLRDQGGTQSLSFTTSTTNLFNEIQLLLRLSGSAPCGQITGAYRYNSGGDDLIALPDFGTSCAARPTLVSAPATPLILNRGSPPRTLDLLAEVTAGTAAVNRLAGLACVAPGGAVTACDEPSFLAEGLFVVDAITDFPARVTLRARDPVDPPPARAGALRPSVATANGSQSSDLVVRVEPLPVAELSLDVPDTIVLGDTAQLQVQTSRNRLGGNESREVRWSIEQATLPAELRTEATQWLSADGRFDAPLQIGARSTLEVTVVATPPSAEPNLDARSTLVLQRPGELSCTLFVGRSTLAPGESTEIRVEGQRADGTSITVPATFTADRGAIEGGVYRAPSMSGTDELRAESTECGVLTRSIEVRDVVRATLSLSDARLGPGATSIATLTLESASGSELPPLRFALSLPEVIRAGQAKIAGVALHTDEERLLRWGGGGRRAVLRLPLIARAGRSGAGTLRINIVSDAARDVVGHAEATLRVDPDPSFSDATVVGRVFEDRDGDGVLDEDESGIAGVLIGTSQSTYVVSDAGGRFSIPRLNPARTVIAVDAASLPFGARLSTAARRVLTLTAGQLHQVRFGVHPSVPARPLALTATPLGLALREGEPVFRVRLASPGHALDARGLNGDVLSIPLEPGQALVSVVAPNGVRSLYVLRVGRYASEERGELVTLLEPRLLSTLVLPLEGATIERSTLSIRPRLGQGVTFHARAGEAQCTGAKRCVLELRGDARTLDITVDPPADAYGDDPAALRLTVPIAVAPASHFFVGRAGMELGVDPSDGWSRNWLGGGAFFYRGRLGDQTLLTAGADIDAESLFFRTDGSLRRFGGVAHRLLGHDATRVFRDLDPERYYPTYGDASLAIDERESGGRFFFRLQRGEDVVRWGGLNTALDDAWVGRYVRSLYGLGGTLSVENETSELGARVRFFAAQPDSAAARDELVVTGSSLYRLRHTRVVEGSVRVTLETLDELSGLPVRTTPLVEGVDFEMDYATGRLVLDGALSAVSGTPQLTRLGGGTFRKRMLVEYEYLTSGGADEDWSIGARVDAHLGDTTLGVTGVSELEGGTSEQHPDTSYGLIAATLRTGHERLRLRLDVARSEGTSHDSARSPDGGLRYRDERSEKNDGLAAAAELMSELGPLSMRAYGRFQQEGFSDSRVAPGERRLQAGTRAALNLGATDGWMLLDHLESRRDDLRVRQTALVGASHELGPFIISAEGRLQREPRTSATRTIVGAQAAYVVGEATTVTLRRAQPFSDRRPGETAAGLEVGKRGEWNGRGELGVDDEGAPFGRAELGIPLDEQDELYAGIERRVALREDVFDESRGDSVLLGGRRRLADGTRLYAEQRLSMDGIERRMQRAVGFDLPRGPTRYFVMYSRTALEFDALELDRGRDAVSTGIVYGGETLRARVSVDARRDGGDESTLTLGGSTRVDWLPRAGLAFGLGLRGGEDLSTQGARIARSWEGTAGFAWRTLPWATWFGRVAFDTRSAPRFDDRPVDSSQTHIAASAVALDLVPSMTITPKIAFRRTRARLEEQRLLDRATLSALRGDLHLADSWDLAVEGRRCTSAGDAARYGVLTEASLLVLRWLRLGAGYNFSSIAAGGVECEAPTARGLFIRAEALY